LGVPFGHGKDTTETLRKISLGAIKIMMKRGEKEIVELEREGESLGGGCPGRKIKITIRTKEFKDITGKKIQ